MLQVTNRSERPIAYAVGKDDKGETKLVEILPGETGSVPFDEDHPQIAAHKVAGAISIGGQAKAKATRTKDAASS